MLLRLIRTQRGRGVEYSSLLSRKRRSVFRIFLVSFHVLMVGARHHPLVEYEFDEIRAALARDREAANVGWLTLIKTPGNRKRLRIMIAIAFFSQWSGNNLM